MPSVFLAPSFQEKNIGVVNYGTEEFRMNKVADVVQEILIFNGIKVKRNDPDKDLYGNITLSNASGCDIHLALHSNAAGGGTAKGTEVFCWPEGTQSEKLATLIYIRLSKLTPWVDRGVKDGRKLAEIRDTKHTSALIEIDFHNNPESALWIINNIKEIGTAIALGTCDYFGISGKVPGEAISPDKDKQIVELQKQVQALTAQINEIKGNAKAAQQYLKRINPDFIG